MGQKKKTYTASDILNDYYKRQKGNSVNASQILEQYQYDAKYPSQNIDLVDNTYIEKFIDDANSYFGTDWNGATSNFGDLYSRARTIRTWLYGNKNKLDSKSYNSLSAALDQAEGGISQVYKYYSQWNSEDAYKKSASGWLNTDAKSTEEMINSRKEIYKNNQNRLSEIENSLPGIAGSWVPDFFENWFLSDEQESLRDEGERIKSENTQYERTQWVTDKYYVPSTPEFEANAAFRDYTNPSEDEFRAYDSSLSQGSYELNNGGYFDDDGNIRDKNGNIVQYANSPNVEDKLALYLENKDRVPEAISRIAGTTGAYKDTWAELINEGQLGHWEKLEENEIKIYYHLLKTEGQESAYQFLSDMSTELSRRATQSVTDYINKAPVLEKIFLNAASIPMSALGGVAGFVEDAVNLLKGDDINPYSNAHLFSNMASATRQSTALKIDELLGGASIPLIDFSFGDAYQAIMSFADSALTMVIPGGPVLLGMGAATSEMKDLYERGATNGQILAGGLLAGAAEYAFEKISIGELNKLKDMDKKAVKNFWEGFVRTNIMAGIEASEEMATEIANTITDALVMGSQTDWADFETFLKNVINAGLGGFISGGIGGAIASTVNNSQYRKMTYNEGRAIYDGGGLNELVSEANNLLESRTNSKLRALANQVAGINTENSNSLRKRDYRKIGRLHNEVQEMVTKSLDSVKRETLNAQIKSALKEKGVDDIDNTVKIVTNAIEGEKLSKSDKTALENLGGEAFLQQIKKTYRAAIKTVIEEGSNNSVGDDVIADESVQAGKNKASDTALMTETEGVTATPTVTGDAETQIVGSEESTNESKKGVYLRDGGKRNRGSDSQGPISRVERGAEKNQRRKGTRKYADSEISAFVNEGREVTVASLGIAGGSNEHKVRLIESGKETASMKAARKNAAKHGLMVKFVTGDNLTIVDAKGNTISARGYIKGNHVVIRADHPYYTAEQLMRHEIGHYLISQGKINLDEVRERLKDVAGEEGLDFIVKLYTEAYEGSRLTAEEIWEECVCDSLGDMNVFARKADISGIAGQMLREIKNVAKSDAKSPTQTRGSPESSEGSGKVKYSFAGKKSATADRLRLSTAEQLLSDDVDAETVRQKTGWFKGYDDEWRFEIDDSKMQIDLRGLYSNNPNIRRYNQLVDKIYFGDGGTQAEQAELETLNENLEGVKLTPKTLGETVKHDTLFEAYPELKHIAIVFADRAQMPNYADGAYGFGEILIANDIRIDKIRLKSTLIHEIQHAVQNIEGFASGSNPNYAGDRVTYRNTAGEVEARDVSNRVNMTAKQRKNTRPDIDRTDVVFAANSETSLSIVELTNGKKYVKAAIQVIKGSDVSKWAQQVSKFINEEIRNWGDISVTTDEGDTLTITRDTAYKAGTRNTVRNPDGTYRKMTDVEYANKLNAEVHIHELAQISQKTNKPIRQDSKNHRFAKDGFTYRTAYFEDLDGSYYKVTISVGHNGNISTIYNVGRIEKNTTPYGKIKTVYSGSKANIVFNSSIYQNAENVNSNSGEIFNAENLDNHYSRETANHISAIKLDDAKTSRETKQDADARHLPAGDNVENYRVAFDSIGEESIHNATSRGDIVLTSKDEINKAIKESLGDKNLQANYILGSIHNSVKNRIAHDVNADIFKNGEYVFKFSSDSIRHIAKHFNTTPEILKAIYRLYDVVCNYDSVAIVPHNQIRLKFEKKYNDYDYISVEFASRKTRSLNLVTFYITKNNKKIENEIQSPVDIEKSTFRGVSSSNDSISYKGVKINSFDEKFSKNQDKAKTESDAQYLSAVKRGDMRTVERLINEAARQWGAVESNHAPKVIYHGTPSFGFTNIDFSQSADGFSFWASDNENVGNEYSLSGADEQVRVNIGKKSDNSGDDSGIYSLFYRKNNEFVVPCDRSRWDKIPVPAACRGDIATRTTTTRALAKWAYEHGYDSIRFTNIYDHYAGSEPMLSKNVYAFFREDIVKSADLVTYDDNGDVIPLSERFDDENDDIRYQSRRYLDDDSDNYSTDGVHWGIEEGVMTKADARAVWEAIANIEKRRYGSYEKFIDGEYFIESNNLLMLVNTNYRNPLIKTIYKFNDSFETNMLIAKEIIKNAKRNETRHREALLSVEMVLGEGYVEQYDFENSAAYGRQNRRGKGSYSRGNTEQVKIREWHFDDDTEQEQQRRQGLTDREILSLAAEALEADDAASKNAVTHPGI